LEFPSRQQSRRNNAPQGNCGRIISLRQSPLGLLIICGESGSRIIHLHLRAHFVQLCFEISNGRFQFLNLFVLFLKFIEQHHVDRLVTNGGEFGVGITYH
jgi:hypothetical protein